MNRNTQLVVPRYRRCVSLGGRRVRRAARSGLWCLLLAGMVFGLGYPSAFVNDAQANESEPPESRGDLDEDPDIEPLIRNARRYAQEGRFRDAAMVIQQVLDKAHERRSLLIPDPNGTFVPIRVAVERLLQDDTELLNAYRILADGEARGLLAAAERRYDERPLREIEGRLFFSRSGDVAAFRLGAIYLDRRDFVGARRMFERALSHPNPTIDRADIHRRLAAVAAFLGDGPELERIQELLEDRRASFPESINRELRTILDRQRRILAQRAPSSGRPMVMGDSSRRGVMPSLVSEEESGGVWTSLWQTSSSMIGLPSPVWSVPNIRQQPQQQPNRPEIARRWRSGNWLPSGQVYFQGDTAFFKTHHFVNPYRRNATPIPATVALDIETGELKWASDEPAPAALRAGQQGRVGFMPMVAHPNMRTTHPTTVEEQLLFSDGIGQQLSVIDGVVYTVEGHSWFVGMRHQNVGFGGVARPNAGNRLAAIDARSGKVLWRISGDDDSSPDNVPRTFMTAPVSFGDLIYTVAESNDGLYLIAIDPDPAIDSRDMNARIVWETFLCASNMAQVASHTPVGIAMDGGDIYVATGRGVLLAVGAVDGEIVWASYYERSSQTMDANQVRMAAMRGQPIPSTGFSEDSVIPLGDVLAVMPSDAQQISVFDRASGRLLTSHRDQQNSYVLGATDNGIVVGGSAGISRYEVSRTRIRQVWRQSVSDKFGRGAMGEDGIYVPSGQNVVVLNLANGRPQREIHINLPESELSAQVPMGNVYPAGRQVLVSAMGQVYSAVNAGSQLALLTERIEGGEGRDFRLLERRANLLRIMGRLDEAADDMRGAIALARRTDERQPLEAGLFDILMIIAAGDVEGSRVILEEAANLARSDAQITQLAMARAANAAAAGDRERAFALYFEVALDRSGQMIEPRGDDGPTLIAVATYAANRLSRLIADAPELRSKLESLQAEAIQAAIQAGDIDSMISAAHAHPDSEPARNAFIEASRQLMAGDQVELAEAVLRQGIGHSPSQAAWLHMAMAELLEEAGWAQSAMDRWMLIDRTLGDQIIGYEQEAAQRRPVAPIAGAFMVDETGPENGSEEEIAPENGQAAPEDRRTAITASRKAREAIARLEGRIDSNAGVLRDAAYRQAWHESLTMPISLRLGSLDSSDHLDELVLFGSRQQGNTLIGRTADGSDRWILRLPASGATRIFGTHWITFNGNAVVQANGELLRDGHMGFMVSENQLMAYGLVNRGGRPNRTIDPIWDRELDGNWFNHFPGFPGFSGDQSFRGLDTVAVGSGVVAVIVTDQNLGVPVLRVFETRTGRVLWERRFDRNQPMGVGISNGMIGVLVGNDNVVLFDRWNGRQTGEFGLNGRSANTEMLWHPDGLFYVTNNNRVNFVSIPDGELRWAVNGPAQPNIRLTDHGTVLIWGPNVQANFMAVEIASGKRNRVITHREAPQMQRGILDAAMSRDGDVVLVGRDQRFQMTWLLFAQDGPDEPIDLGGPRTTAILQGIGSSSFGKVHAEGVLPRAVPMDNNRQNFEVRLVRRKDGEETENRLPGPANGRFNNLGMAMVRGDSIIVVANDGARAYRAERR
ncbi:MAG: PQQ-binding-like beta-propeller repeat protein [Phycisphaeraceae bacterium]|nr:PQQ-binding-like beta-propeller repeat protein [Phycisphaeraceae bacterium]